MCPDIATSLVNYCSPKTSDISICGYLVYFIYCNRHLWDMLQRGYIILIIGAALLISGIVISALWAGSFAGTFMRENTILSGVSIRPAGSVNTIYSGNRYL